MVVPYTNNAHDISLTEEDLSSSPSSSSSSSLIDGGLNNSMTDLLSIAKPLYDNSRDATAANVKLNGFRNYLMTWDQPWSTDLSTG